MIARGKMGNTETKEIMVSVYLSVDPGVTTGITLWDEYGHPTHYNEYNIEEYNNLLDMVQHCNNIKRIIVEEWVLYQKKALALSGSRLEAVQVIGMTKRCNRACRMPDVVEIRADAKEMAALYSGTKVRKGHMPNWQAAYLIGYYWLHRQGIIPARVLEQA